MTKDKKGYNKKNSNSKQYKYMLKRISKVISWIVMTILGLVGAFLLYYISMNKLAQMRGATPPLALYTIISPSMTPKIQVYDVVFVKKTNPQDIQIGDVISYYSTNTFFGGIPITHRVVEKFNTDDGITFRTRGDANPVADNEVILSNNVVGVVKFVIPQLGRIQFFLSSIAGWIIVILLPAIGIIIYDGIKLMKVIKSKKEVTEIKKTYKTRKK